MGSQSDLNEQSEPTTQDSAAESTTRAPKETYEAALVVSGISTEDERQAVQSAFVDAMAPVKMSHPSLKITFAFQQIIAMLEF